MVQASLWLTGLWDEGWREGRRTWSQHLVEGSTSNEDWLKGSGDGKDLLECPAVIPSMWPPVFWTQVGSCLEDLWIHHMGHHPQKAYRGNRKVAPLERGWHCCLQGMWFWSNLLILYQVQPVLRRSITWMPAHFQNTNTWWGLLLECLSLQKAVPDFRFRAFEEVSASRAAAHFSFHPYPQCEL